MWYSLRGKISITKPRIVPSSNLVSEVSRRVVKRAGWLAGDPIESDEDLCWIGGKLGATFQIL